MSLYSNLPIYNDLFFLLKDLYERVPKFSKQYKYLLGEKMIACCVESVVLIAQISNTRDRELRVQKVASIQQNMEKLLIYIRIGNELNQLGKKSSYFFLSDKIVDILNQTKNWKKSLQKK